MLLRPMRAGHADARESDANFFCTMPLSKNIHPALARTLDAQFLVPTRVAESVAESRRPTCRTACVGTAIPCRGHRPARKRFRGERASSCEPIANLSNCLGNLKFTCVYFRASDPISLGIGEPT
jgi:hypothetical protein